MMNTPETIHIEKYAHALNELIGIDSTYIAGDKNVDAIVELIVAAKKLENRIKELSDANDKLYNDNERLRAIIAEGVKLAKEELIEQIKSDTVRKMQERLKEDIKTSNVFDCAYISARREACNKVDQIAKEMLEENDDYR